MNENKWIGRTYPQKSNIGAGRSFNWTITVWTADSECQVIVFSDTSYRKRENAKAAAIRFAESCGKELVWDEQTQEVNDV